MGWAGLGLSLSLTVSSQKCVKRNRLDKNREKFSHKRKTTSNFQKLEREGDFKDGYCDSGPVVGWSLARVLSRMFALLMLFLYCAKIVHGFCRADCGYLDGFAE